MSAETERENRVAGQLNALNAETGMSKTDLVNRAITLYDFINVQLEKGNHVLVRDNETGELERIRLV